MVADFFRMPELLRCAYVAAIGSALCFAASCASSQHQVGCGRPQQASELKAGGLAYRAFEQALQGEPKDTSDLALFTRQIDNYEVSVADDADFIVFTFAPKAFHGRYLKDGGFRFSLSTNDWSVRRISGFR